MKQELHNADEHLDLGLERFVTVKRRSRKFSDEMSYIVAAIQEALSTPEGTYL